MATLSTLQCVTGAKNTGIGACNFDPKNIVGAFLCPPGYVIPAASLATLQTQLLADSEANSKSARIFPIANFFDFKDSSEAPVVEKFGYGQSNTVRDGVYDWGFRFRLGGLNLSSALRSFNGNSNWFLFVDSKNQLIGTQALDTTSAISIGAIPAIEFYTDPLKPNDGKSTTTYMANFRFLPKFINELIEYVTDPGFDILSTVTGLQDVTLSITSDATPGVYHLKALAGPAQVNLANLGAVSTAIAAVGNWPSRNVLSGAAIVPTSVTVGSGANAGTFTVTLPTTAPPYPAGVSDKVGINLAAPATLAAAGAPGYESLGEAQIVHN